MRSLKTSDDRLYRKLIVKFFNLCFGSKPKSVKYWSVDAKNSILKRFSGAIGAEEMNPNFDLRFSLLVPSLFQRLQDIVGLRLRTSIDDDLVRTGTLREPVIDSDLEEMFALDKSIHRVFFEEGTALAALATKASEGAEHLFKLADEKYKDSLTLKPDDYRALHNWVCIIFFFVF
jgi:hypothetical protein